VKNCEFALAHISSSISYAVMFKKPLLLLCSNEYREIYRNSYMRIMRAFAKALETTIFNIDDDDVLKKTAIGSIDQNKYDEYKYNYLSSRETEETLTKDIFVKTLLKYPTESR
jgi:hypothetical protein